MEESKDEYRKIFSDEFSKKINYRFGLSGETEIFFTHEKIYIEFCEETNMVRLPHFDLSEGQFERVFEKNLFKEVEKYQKVD